MRTIGANLLTHCGQETTTLARLWKVTRRDGQVFGFTNHDAALPVSGVTYAAATGMNASAVRTNLGLAVDNLEVQGAFDSAAITEADLRAGLWDYARIDVYEVNWASVADGVQYLRRGYLGRVSARRGEFLAELLGLAVLLAQPVGRSILAPCDADLGDARCGINIATYTVTGTITGVTNKRVCADASRSEADGIFNFGKITWTAGLNNGLSAEVKSYLLSGGAIQLMLPMPFTIQVGDTYSLTYGCDKKPATCAGTFNNILNHRGDPFVPGPDEILQYPDAH